LKSGITYKNFIVAAPVKKNSQSITGYKIKEDRVLENYSESQDEDEKIFEISAGEISEDGINISKVISFVFDF